MKIQIVMILGLFTFAYCNDLMCYDCDPESEGKCVKPKEHNVKMTHCIDIPMFAPNAEKQISESNQQEIIETVSKCVSLYIETGGNGSGVYRGCIKTKKNILNVCDYLRENQRSNGNITSCETCGESKCNLHNLGGGAVGLTPENLSDNSSITTCLNCTTIKNDLDYLSEGAVGLLEENRFDKSNITTRQNCTKSKNNLDYFGESVVDLTQEKQYDNSNITTCLSCTENTCKQDYLEMGLAVYLVIIIIIQKVLLCYWIILQNSSRK